MSANLTSMKFGVVCDVCNEDITDLCTGDVDRYGDFVVSVKPCPLCIERAVEEAIAEQDGDDD